jgi:hypothetical protein
MKGLGIAVIALTCLWGCSSTDKSLPVVNGELVYPSMPILKDEVYQWDNSKSEALNVVEMARPAGIGNSVQDYANGEHATIGYIGAGSGLIGAALGLATSGLMGVVQEESTRAGANQLTLFNPTVVDVVDSASVSVNGQPNYKKVRNYLAKKIMAAIDQEHENVGWSGVYSIYDGQEKHDLILLIDDLGTCKKYMQARMDDIDAEPFMVRNLSKVLLDGEDIEKSYCAIGFNISVTQRGENNKLVLVAEAESGGYFMDALIEHYDGFVVVPDYFKLNRFNSVETDYSYVSKHGQKILFQRPTAE